VVQPSEEALIGPVRRFGRYTLIKKLATGGMAEIWLARQRGLAGFNRFIVIKKILAHLSEQQTFVDMFLDEARTSAALTHPNIVQIYDLGREGDAYFIAMEFIEGENLAALAWRGMKKGSTVSPGHAARIIADTSKALHYAHHLKNADGRPLEIVHRDVSPQNVLVTYEGDVKVVDFGIAKAATKSEQTKTGMLKGKFSYMSPEQCLGARVDKRSDIFALGILLYELTTGKRLFKHESELMILEMITKRAVIPPRQVAPHIPAQLERIILRALEKDVTRRHPTAQDLQLDLEAFLRDEAPCTNQELGRYVRTLFPDKIEEKRKLREIASRDDFESRFSQEDIGPRRTVHGLPPSQVRVGPASGTRPTGVTVGPATAATRPMHPQVASGSSSLPYTDLATSGTSGTGAAPIPGPQTPRIVIAVALIIILAATITLLSLPGRLEPGVGGEASLQTGSIILESRPPGATIYLDGSPMRLPEGGFARTPADLSPLQFGRTYDLALKLDGHEPYEQALDMNGELDGTTVAPTLVPLPGDVTVRVEADAPDRVAVFAGAVRLGTGPRIRRSFPGGASIRLRAQAEGLRCEGGDEPIEVPPGGATDVVFRCQAPPASPKPTPPARSASTLRAPSSTPRRRTSPTKPAVDRPSSGCAPNPDLPMGYLTIDTRPHSTVFFGGRKLGETPLSKVKVPSGCLELTVRYGDQSKTLKVRIQPNLVSAFREEL
jgi:serine/threonine protein kinase